MYHSLCHSLTRVGRTILCLPCVPLSQHPNPANHIQTFPNLKGARFLSLWKAGIRGDVLGTDSGADMTVYVLCPRTWSTSALHARELCLPRLHREAENRRDPRSCPAKTTAILSADDQVFLRSLAVPKSPHDLTQGVARIGVLGWAMRPGRGHGFLAGLEPRTKTSNDS